MFWLEFLLAVCCDDRVGAWACRPSGLRMDSCYFEFCWLLVVMLLPVSPHTLYQQPCFLQSMQEIQGGRVERAPWAVAAGQESTKKTPSDELTFAFALHRNLGVSESSLMFTVSEQPSCSVLFPYKTTPQSVFPLSASSNLFLRFVYKSTAVKIYFWVSFFFPH